MLNSPIILDRINITPPVANIYRRLGFKKKITSLTQDQQKETDHYIHEAQLLVSLKGSLLRLDIDSNDGKKIILAGDLVFVSTKLAAFLRDCRETVLMGATAGSPILEAIKEKTLQNNLAAAVVYDATASEMADATLDWMMDYLNRQIRREGKTLLPRRFSAGYADFHLENQKTIYKKLQLEKIGVTINSNYILIPEKSVTAITGICNFV